MPILTTVLDGGYVCLDHDMLRKLGFRPGAWIQITPTLAGSLIVSLDDTPVTVEAPARALPTRERRMLGVGR